MNKRRQRSHADLLRRHECKHGAEESFQSLCSLGRFLFIYGNAGDKQFRVGAVNIAKKKKSTKNITEKHPNE